MKHLIKMVSRLMLMGLTLSCGFFAIKSNTRIETATFADNAPLISEKQYSAADFTDEFEADTQELGATLTQSNTTNTSQSLNFAFSSKTLVAFTTARQNYVVNITDPAFTGDYKNPVEEGYEKVDPESGLPILEGSVIFVTGSSANKKVYLPQTLTRDETFILTVTSIASHAVTADGAEYNGNNKWTKITDIFIPSSIKSVQSNAFTGVPASGVTIHYEGDSLPSGFASDWTDADPSNIHVASDSYTGSDTFRFANVGGNPVTDIQDEHGRPVNFVLGCRQDGSKYVGDQYDRPLVLQYDKVSTVNGAEHRETIYQPLKIMSENTPYDSVGRISNLDFSRTEIVKLNNGETIDDQSIVLHNIMKISADAVIDTSKRYYIKPTISYAEKLDLSRLLTFKASSNSTFIGYSMFTLTMDKNLGITSSKYPEPHSYYVDAKEDLYLQNKTRIDSGKTVIRYSLYNLYKTSYHFVYEGDGGVLKDVMVPISSVISYQTLESDKNNKVSVLVKNSDIASDFSAEKVRTFEIVDVTIQLDLFATSDTGSRSVLAKSQVQYKFGYITVIDNQKINIFNWNVFIIIFVIAFLAIFAGASFGLYKYMKEKYKNDEFRRVNDKKFLKKSILYGLGSLIIALAILFIVMRASGFANTIVVFNPTDPLLIAFSVVGIIIAGYFIVAAIKTIKTNRERRQAIRLRLNEDVADDGTN